jgi:hypothetical protein
VTLREVAVLTSALSKRTLTKVQKPNAREETMEARTAGEGAGDRAGPATARRLAAEGRATIRAGGPP